MKTIISLLAVLFAYTVSGQKLKESEVPKAVMDAVKKLHPGVKVEKWEKENGNYEAELKIKGIEHSYLFTATGDILESEEAINISELPKGVSDYLSKNLPGKKIKEASKTLDPTGSLFYEAEVDDTDYIFDSEGNFLKKIEESDSKKD